MSVIDKSLVLRRFSNSAEHYDLAATPQKHFAQHLLRLMQSSNTPPHPGEVLEVGCGTGLLSQGLIEWLGEDEYHYTLNDLSPAVEPLLREKVGLRHSFLLGDAEELEWQKAHYTLIASSSAIQWWHHPLRFVSKACNALLPMGQVAFTTFLPTNLYQLSQVTHQSLPYHSLKEYQEVLKASHFHTLELQESRYTLHFPTIIPLLQHLKQTGTNALSTTPNKMWTKRGLELLEHQYREALHLNAEEPLPLTYVALLVIAQKNI